MSDTQWPRFEVFKQDKPGQPHRNVGSIHAPDAEIAWLNARDVFARRPACHSLWVVNESAIATSPALPETMTANDGVSPGPAAYAVFAKQSQRQAMTYVDYVGQLTAETVVEALDRASDAFPDVVALVWWACRDDAIVRDEFAEAEDLLAPGQTKLFRMPNQYHTVFTMQKLRHAEEEEE